MINNWFYFLVEVRFIVKIVIIIRVFVIVVFSDGILLGYSIV